MTISAAGKPQSDHAIGRKLHKNIKSENQSEKREKERSESKERGGDESSLTNSTGAELGPWTGRLFWRSAQLGPTLVG